MDESLGPLGTFIPLVLMVALMYFLLIRPQNKKKKKLLKCAFNRSGRYRSPRSVVSWVTSRASKKIHLFWRRPDRVKLRFKRWAIQEVEKLNLEGNSASSDASKKSLPKIRFHKKSSLCISF